MKKLAAYIVPVDLLVASCTQQPQVSQQSADDNTAAAQNATSPAATYDANQAFGQGKVVELRNPESNKVVVKLMFKNGSMSDPEGKEGLTHATAQILLPAACKP